NFDVVSFAPDLSVTLIQIAVGLVMPVAVALFPIVDGTRISVYDAIYQYGLATDEAEGWIERMLAKVRNLKNPIVALALRNTFRKKARLAFTLVTLTLAGAMFVAVFSTRTSLNAQISQVTRYTDFDATLSVSADVKRTTVEREALRIPGVTVAEGWGSTIGEVISSDESEGEEVQLISTDPHSRTIDPLLIDGRWLRE
ncbi:MAG: ABC transporter permease, partial [Anaerolineae bacterium]|nr:ABC transporter permease [Anaerolineae bacterium]